MNIFEMLMMVRVHIGDISVTVMVVVSIVSVISIRKTKESRNIMAFMMDIVVVESFIK